MLVIDVYNELVSLIPGLSRVVLVMTEEKHIHTYASMMFFPEYTNDVTTYLKDNDSYNLIADMLYNEFGWCDDNLIMKLFILHEYSHYLCRKNQIFNFMYYEVHKIKQLIYIHSVYRDNKKLAQSLYRELPDEKWCDNNAIALIKQYVYQLV